MIFTHTAEVKSLSLPFISTLVYDDFVDSIFLADLNGNLRVISKATSSDRGLVPSLDDARETVMSGSEIIRSLATKPPVAGGFCNSM